MRNGTYYVLDNRKYFSLAKDTQDDADDDAEENDAGTVDANNAATPHAADPAEAKHNGTDHATPAKRAFSSMFHSCISECARF